MSEKIHRQNNSSRSSSTPQKRSRFDPRPFADERDKQPSASPTPGLGFNLANISLFPPETSKAHDEDVQLKPVAQTLLPEQEQETKPDENVQLKPVAQSLPPEQQEENKENTDLQSVQTKLTVGTPGDKYEQEADSMAAKVMAMPDSAIQQPGKHQIKDDQEEIHRKPLANSITQGVQRKATSETTQANSSIESHLASSKGGGSPLPDDVRSFMEPRFGSDFSAVRVHTDSIAVQMNKELGAQAFAYGNHIYYGAGKSPGKDELTAHELTHTIQQTGGVRLNKEVQRRPKQEEEKLPSEFHEAIKNQQEGLTTGIATSIQAKADPGQVLEQLKNTPPTSIFTAYDQAGANSAGAWEAQKQQLEKSIPKIPAPTGLPAQKSGSKEKSTAKAAGNKETHVLGATKEQNALKSDRLNTSQISTEVGKSPTVNLTGAADPAQIDSAQLESSKQVQQAKAGAAQEIYKDFGENNIYPEPSNEILKANKEITTAQVPGGKGGKVPAIPGEIVGNLNQSLEPTLKQRIGAEQQKYVVGQQKFDKDTAKARTDAEQKIAKQNKETSQKQLQEQKLAKTEVQASKQEWQTELNAAEKQYQQKAATATQDQKKKITTEKQKGEQTAAKHIAEAENKAEQEKQKAENEAKQKEESGKKDSGNLWDKVKSVASAVVDGIKQAVNFIYDNLRKAVKFIFEQAKKLALAAIELAQKVIVGLIQAFGEILKGLVNVVFAAFPEIAKKINSKIDQAIAKAVKAVNVAADLLKKAVAAVLDFLANTLDSLLKLVQDIYNGVLTVIGMIVRGEFAELMKRLGNLVNAAKAAPPQFETAGYEELLGGNFDEPLSPAELAQAGRSPAGANGGGHGATDAPKAPWSEANVGVDAVEHNMELSPELQAELIQHTKGGGEVELASSNDASRTMDAVMSEATGEKQGEGKEQKNPDDGLSPRQRAEIRWQLMKTGISQWWSNNWPKVVVGATAAIGGFIALNVVTGGAVTAALPAIMSVVGPLFAGVTIAQIGGNVRDYLAKGWAGDIQGGGKSLAKGLAAGAIELVSTLTFKAGGAALKGAKALAKGGVKLAKGAMNLIAKGAKFIIEKGKVLFKGIAGTGVGKGFQRLRQLGEGLLERMRFKKFSVTISGRRIQLWGHINPKILLAEGTILDEAVAPEFQRATFGDAVKTASGKKGILLSDDAITSTAHLPNPPVPTTRSLKDIKKLRGKARWEAGEQFVEELYQGRKQHFRFENTGGRHVDVVPTKTGQTHLKIEVKTYQKYLGKGQVNEVPLNIHIQEQILKDAYLQAADPHNYHPKWIFTDAGPSQELAKTLDDFGIPYTVYDLSLIK